MAEHDGARLVDPESSDRRVTRTRALVLDAGARLLFTHGWNAVTHLRVAEESGVGRATVYRHWPTVEDLLSDVLVGCQAPLEAPAPSGDLRADLMAALAVFVEPLQTSKLPDIIVSALDRAPTDRRIEAVHRSMTAISRAPVWKVAAAAIDRGELDATLTESAIASHTIGPVLYQYLFDREPISETELARVVDAFLAAYRRA